DASHDTEDKETDHAHGAAEDAHEEDSKKKEDASKGPNGGRRFTQGDFGLELKLAETEGSAPTFMAWLTHKGQPAAPTGAEVTVTLSRPGGAQQEIWLTPRQGFLASDAPVAEPHFFDATVAATTPTQSHR